MSRRGHPVPGVERIPVGGLPSVAGHGQRGPAVGGRAATADCEHRGAGWVREVVALHIVGFGHKRRCRWSERAVLVLPVLRRLGHRTDHCVPR